MSRSKNITIFALEMQPYNGSAIHSDALFVATNAPGHSAYNPIERRMVPLSHDFFSLILPYDYYGDHLNAGGKTVDISLEKTKFSTCWW